MQKVRSQEIQMVNNLEWKLVNTFSVFSPLKFQDIPKGRNEDFPIYVVFRNSFVSMDSNLLVTTEIQGNPQSDIRFLSGLGIHALLPQGQVQWLWIVVSQPWVPRQICWEAMKTRFMFFGHVTPNSRGSKGILLGMWRLGKCDGIHLKCRVSVFSVCRNLSQTSYG